MPPPPETAAAGRESVYARVCERILAAKRSGRPLVAGVTGIDTSGKTEFALALGRELAGRGAAVQLVHLDDFHRPKRERYAGASEAENYYERSFDLPRLVAEVLEPIRSTGRLRGELRLLDLHTDDYDLRRRYEVGPETIVVLEGVFLLRPELRDHLDLVVLLDMPFDVAHERARARDLPVFGEDVLRKYREKYLPAQRRHFAEVDPRRVADVVVDNSDWRRPRLVRG